MSDNFLYRREKTITMQLGNITRKFLLISLSAKAQEEMFFKAQEKHAETVKLLYEKAETLYKVFLLQEQELLVEAIFKAEQEAVLGGRGAEQDICEDWEKLLQELRSELIKLGKERLAEKLVSLEINRRLYNAWAYAVLDARLVESLCDEKRNRLFVSADAMREAFSPEILERLYEEMIMFLEEEQDPRGFPKPHTSRV